MASVRATVNRIDELERNGFEKKQALVLAMAIDETVEDRLERVVEHFDARFDGIDARFDGINSQLKGIDSKFEGINAKLDSRKYEIIVHMTILFAAIGSIGMLIYDIFVKPLMN